MSSPSLVDLARRRRDREQAADPAVFVIREARPRVQRACATKGCRNRLHKNCLLDVCAYCRVRRKKGWM